MKPIEIKANADSFLKNLPIVEPIIVLTSREAAITDNVKMIVLAGAGVKLTLPESLTKDCSFSVVTLDAPVDNTVITTSVAVTRSLNTKATFGPAEEIAVINDAPRIDCHYKVDTATWYIFSLREVTANVIQAAVANETLRLNDVLLSDRSNVVPDYGAIAINERGDFTCGDGVKKGGREIGHPNRLWIRNSFHIPAADIIAGTVLQKRLGLFRLRANEWVLGQRSIIIGQMMAQITNVHATIGSIAWRLRPVGTTGNGMTLSGSGALETGGAPKITFVNTYMQFKQVSASPNIGLGLDVATEAIGGVYVSGTFASSNSSVITYNSSGIAIFNASALPNAPQDLELFIAIPQDPAFNPAGYMRLFIDVQLVLL